MLDDDALRKRYEERLSQAGRERVLDWMLSAVETRFTLRLDQLRDSAGTCIEQAAVIPDTVRDARRRLTRDKRRAIEGAVESFISAMKVQAEIELTAAIPDDKPNDSPPVVLHHEAAVLAPLMLLGPDRLSDLSRPLESTVSNWEELNLAIAYLGWKTASSTPSAVLDACIPAAVSEFEDLLAALFRIGQLLHPEGLGAGRRQTTLAEIEARGGTELARLWAIDKAARDVIDQGPLEWRRRLGNWPGIDPAQFLPNWEAFAEVFHRRNALVHASSRADEKYLALVTPSADSPRLGEPLHCDQDYVLKALDMFLAVGRGLAAIWLPKLLPGAGFELHRSDEAVLVLLTRERWELAATLSSAFLTHSTNASHALRVNNWMARRELAESPDSIVAEVGGWVPPGEGIEWRVARAALLEQSDEVRALLAAAEVDGESMSEYASWPLIRQLRRKDARLDVLMIRKRWGSVHRR